MNKQLSIKKWKIFKLPPVIYMLLCLVIIFSMATPQYLSFQNIKNILMQSSTLMILAFGQTLVVLTQGTDLSIGAQVSMVTVAWITLARKGVPLPVGAIIVLLLTSCVGIINGLLVAKGKMPPFIATFGMQNVINSFTLLLTAGAAVTYSSNIFLIITESSLFGIKAPVFIAAGIFAVTWVILNRTKFGMGIFGLGGNPEALALAGVNTVKVTVKAYAYAGLLAGVAGLLTACRVESGQPTAGAGLEFESIAATLLGGTSMREGRGNVTNTIFGVLLLSVVRNGLNVVGITAVYQSAIIGIIMLSAIIIDSLARQSQERN